MLYRGTPKEADSRAFHAAAEVEVAAKQTLQLVRADGGF